jgi:hypothetical protein
MKIHSKVIVPLVAAKTGGALKDFVWDRIVSGERITFENGEVVVNSTNQSVQPTFTELQAIVIAGGSFEGIRLGIEFATGADAAQDVPAVVRGSTYIDENEVEQTRNWLEWFAVNTSTQVITNGTLYVAKAAFNGGLLNSEELTAIHAQTGVQVLEWADAIARFQDENYTVYEL